MENLYPLHTITLQGQVCSVRLLKRTDKYLNSSITEGGDQGSRTVLCLCEEEGAKASIAAMVVDCATTISTAGAGTRPGTIYIPEQRAALLQLCIYGLAVSILILS